MNIIYSEKRLPFLEKKESAYVLNVNQRYVAITQGEEETHVWEIYQEKFTLFPSMREKLDAVKSAVTMYANSNAVKRFILGTTEAWLDSEQRASIKDAVEATAKAGGTEYTLWLNDTPHVLTCEKALDVISALELYSSKCYNATAQCHADIEKCGTDIEKACEIDFTVIYPEKPVLNM